MSQIQKGIFGALAVALTLGAAQFAAGQDLIGQQVAGIAAETGINRSAKADRAAAPSASTQTRTIALRLNGLSDTSVLVRLPVAEESRARPAGPSSLGKPGKTAVACEPMVSVLTEVAKLLQPGRCVT